MFCPGINSQVKTKFVYCPLIDNQFKLIFPPVINGQIEISIYVGVELSLCYCNNYTNK